MPDREEKHSILSPRFAADSAKDHGLFAALEALKSLNASTFSFGELTNQITARTRSALRVQCVALWLADDLHKSISLHAYSCIDYVEILPKNFYYSLEKPSTIAECLQKGKASLHKKYALAENDPRVEVLPKNMAGALLPLLTPAGAIGVLEILSTSDDPIDKAELEALEVLASQIALLLSNRQNADQVSHQSALQKQLYEITTKINQARDFESILQITVEELCTALNLPGASMHVNLATTSAFDTNKPVSNPEQSS